MPQLPETLSIPSSAPPSIPKLTPREQDLVRAILDGLSNKEIAARLGISVQTVKNGLGPVFDKYHVSSRLELAIRAATRPF
jgi:DNA-binding NarL/FixJ family response regulator